MKETRQERRERRRRNARKMAVSGKSAKLLHQIVLDKSKKVEKKEGTK